MDKVTGCAKLYAEFGIMVVPCCPLLGGIVPPFWGNGADIVSAAYADELKNFYRNTTGRKLFFRPVHFIINLFR